jgi:hypothetical protein
VTTNLSSKIPLEQIESIRFAVRDRGFFASGVERLATTLGVVIDTHLS